MLKLVMGFRFLRRGGREEVVVDLGLGFCWAELGGRGAPCGLAVTCPFAISTPFGFATSMDFFSFHSRLTKAVTLSARCRKEKCPIILIS